MPHTTPSNSGRRGGGGGGESFFLLTALSLAKCFVGGQALHLLHPACQLVDGHARAEFAEDLVDEAGLGARTARKAKKKATQAQ